MPELTDLLPSVTASTFWADASKLTVIVGALWALLNYSRSSRTKAAEIVIQLEEKYAALQPILLRMEYQQDFERVYAPALAKVVGAIPTDDRPRAASAGDEERTSRPVLLTTAEGRAIDELERVFRYFHLCLQIRRLGVDGRSLDFLCHYYLRLFRRHDRALVLQYLHAYWPRLAFWAEVAGYPAPRRLAIASRQIVPRVRAWWRGPAHPVESLGHSTAGSDPGGARPAAAGPARPPRSRRRGRRTPVAATAAAPRSSPPAGA